MGFKTPIVSDTISENTKRRNTMHYIDWMEIIYWSLFVLLIIGEILVVFVFKLDKKHVVRDWVEPAFEAMIIATILRIFVIQAFAIPTPSMEDTLLVGDHPMAIKFAYGLYNPLDHKMYFDFNKPKRGDVVIFRDPTGKTNAMWIKRCMGLPGDVMSMKDKVLYINGIQQIEPYVTHKDINIYPAWRTNRDNFPPTVVPPGTLFMMGDNRDESYDSRFFGFLPYNKVRGKAVIVYWPLNRIKIIKHVKINAGTPPSNTAMPSPVTATAK
jgi:signal peptidase I